MSNNLPIELPELLRRLSEGDERAFRLIYNSYWKSVYRTAERYLRDSELAQDVVQEVFAGFWNKRDSFEHVENLESYLVVTTQHFTYRQLRKLAAESKNFEAYQSELSDVSNNEIEDMLLSKQYDELLAKAIEGLPPQQKQVFKLSREEGLSYEAIAARLQISQGTVKNHMVRALNTLRNVLAPHINASLVLALSSLLAIR